MKILKKVIEIGNGAAIYVPKEYLGRNLIITIPEGIEEIKARVLIKLIPFMPNIIGVYLYGSYARNEESKDSDIDILVITKEKDEFIKKILLDDMDLRILTSNGIQKAVKNYPALIMPILNEAKPFINPELIESLKNQKIKYSKFKWNFDEIKRTIKIIEKLIEIDDKDISTSFIYSIIMRIRVCYLIESLLNNKKATNSNFYQLLSDRGLQKEEIEKYIDIYKKVREGEKISISKIVN